MTTTEFIISDSASNNKFWQNLIQEFGYLQPQLVVSGMMSLKHKKNISRTLYFQLPSYWKHYGLVSGAWSVQHQKKKSGHLILMNTGKKMYLLCLFPTYKKGDCFRYCKHNSLTPQYLWGTDRQLRKALFSDCPHYHDWNKKIKSQ